MFLSTCNPVSTCDKSYGTILQSLFHQTAKSADFYGMVVFFYRKAGWYIQAWDDPDVDGGLGEGGGVDSGVAN